MTFTHQHTTENDELDGSETELSGSEECHAHNVATGLQLTVGLYLYLVAQTVEDQCLLGFCQTDFRRDTCITD